MSFWEELESDGPEFSDTATRFASRPIIHPNAISAKWNEAASLASAKSEAARGRSKASPPFAWLI